MGFIFYAKLCRLEEQTRVVNFLGGRIFLPEFKSQNIYEYQYKKLATKSNLG